MQRSGAEVALSLGVVALGVGVAAVTATLPSEGGYAGVGPNFIPAVVAGGIILLGIWLSIEVFAGGWRDMPEHTDKFEPMPFAWVSAGLTPLRDWQAALHDAFTVAPEAFRP